MHDNRSQGVPSVTTVRDQNVSVNAVVISDRLKAGDDIGGSLYFSFHSHFTHSNSVD
jgi:hypothetical protein